MRLPWPLRRRPDPAAPSEHAGGATASLRSDAAGSVDVDVDPGFAAGFRARAGARDATPVLGPWAGLGETARFAVAASRFQGTLLTQRWSDELAAASAPLARDAGEFVASLPSLASYADPTGAPGESGSPFADSLPVTAGTGTFAAQGAVPAVPAFSATAGQRPSRPPLPSPPAARPAAGSVSSRAGQSVRAALQRRVDPGARVRSEVSEAPPAAAGLRAATPVAEGAAAAALELAGSPTETLPELPPAPPGPLTVEAGSSNLRRAEEPPLPLAETAAPPYSPSGPEELRVARTEASAAPPAAAEVATPAGAPAEAAPAARRTLAAGAPAEHEPLESRALLADAGGAAPPLESGADSPGVPVAAAGELPLMQAPASTPPDAEPPAAAIAASGAESALPARGSAPEAGSRLVPDEAPPPLGASAGSSGVTAAPGPAASPPLRRFAVGEPLAPGTASATNVARVVARAGPPGPQAGSALRGSPRGVPESVAGAAERAPAAPIASPGAPGRVHVTRTEPAPNAGPGPLELARSVGSPPADTSAPATTAARALDPERHAALTLHRSAEPALIPEAPAPPLPVLQGDTAVRRAIVSSPAEPLSAFRADAAGTHTAAGSLPLARPDGRAVVGSDAGQRTVTGAPGSWSLAAGFRPGAESVALDPVRALPGGPVQRAADGGEAGGEGAPTAVGEVRAAEDPAKADQDLDKLTEKVWQRIRRTLQLERERRRGLP